jgi:lysophospholipase L1-like esterase
MIDAAQHYAERLAAFREETVAPGGIVLLGSSHLEWFDAPRFLPGYPWVNRGIASDRLGLGERGILKRLDVSVFDLQPVAVVFENGANDLGELWRTGQPPLEAIAAAYDAVVQRLRAFDPALPIIVINALPTRGRFDGLNPLVNALNPAVAATAERYGCTFIDLHRELIDAERRLPATLTDDGLHLNDAGYARFADHLRPALP